MSQEFGEISFGQFWGGICHKVMVRCQGTLQSLEGLTGCDMQDADLGCWQLVLATEWNLSWDHQPEHSTVTSPHHLGFCTAWPPGKVGVRLLPWSGAKKATWEPNCIMWLSVELAASRLPHFIGYEQVIEGQPSIKGRGGRPYLSIGAGSKNPQACSKVAKQG